MAKEKIVFVFPSYPDVMYSFLLSFAKKSDADITIIYLKELLSERVSFYLEDELSKYVKFIHISPDNLNEGFDSIFEKNKSFLYCVIALNSPFVIFSTSTSPKYFSIQDVDKSSRHLLRSTNFLEVLM